MMLPPLLFSDLGIMFMVGAVLLLLSTELLSAQYGQTNIVINYKKMRRITFIVTGVFFIFATIQLILLIL
ncbi:MAG: hypothetical protein LBH62_09170 [Nitrososphaerota archaeon]|nr:hypothetical protein [Nitrososphaerota archaeon]